MPHSYGLAQWRWNAAEQSHEPPPGAFAVIDLRPVSEQANAGQSDGWGFFSWPDQIYNESGVLVANANPMPLDAVSLGYGDCRELQPTTAQRDELRTRLGLSAQPAGATLIDCVSDVLGSLADPTGVSGPKPLLPTREGLLEIHLAYHSRVRAETFVPGPLFVTTATGRNNRIREVLRSDLETAYASGGAELLAKVLGGWCDKWGVDYSQAAKWRNLIRGPMLARLLDEGRGQFKPKKPQTSYSDDFNRADSSTLGSPWNYYFIAGTGPYESTFGIASNVASHYKPSTDGSGVDYCAYMSALSSADHWCQVTLNSSTIGANGSAYVICRQTSVPDRNHYRALNNFSSGSNSTLQISKLVSGTGTTIVNDSSRSKTLPWTMKLDVSGSTLTAYWNGTAYPTGTDTAHTGNLYCGLGSNISSRPGTNTFDDWSCDDGITAGAVCRLLLLGVG